jgi:hypothetical protein
MNDLHRHEIRDEMLETGVRIESSNAETALESALNSCRHHGL